ncbi:lamin tail domain-containing protein, partial [Chloroflexota bacterium]
MYWKRPNRSKYALILSVLCFVMLAAITVLASPLESDNSYLPLVILQRPSPTPSTTGLLLITEVLYNPLVEPAGEWIEIYNPGTGPVILSAYKLGDEPALGGKEGMLQFPVGRIMDPGEVIVVANKGATFHTTYGFPPDFEMNDSDPTIPDMLTYFAWSTGKVELVNTGDEILILDGEDNLVDHVSWGDSTWEEAFDPTPPSADNGESLERSPAYNDSNTAADWVIAATPGPYQLNLSPPTPVIPTGPTTLLISEVFFNPSGDNPGGEWVEIYNAGQNNALLSDFRLGDAVIQGSYEGMYYFPKGAVLFSGEGVVIANQSTVFEANYGFKPDFEISDSDTEISNMFKDSDWGKGSMNFKVSEDEVIILDHDDLIVDGVSWGNSTVILDQSVPEVDPDHSIERYPAFTDTDSAADWRDQSDPDPGQFDLSMPTITPSPTATNPPEPLPALIINEIHADPDGALGDANGDGDPDNKEDEFLEIVNTTDA